MKAKNRKLIPIVLVISVIAIALVSWMFISGNMIRGQFVETLNGFRQLQIARQTMELDRFTSGEEYSTSVPDALTKDNYLTESDLARITDGYEMQYFPLDRDPNAKDKPAIIATGKGQVITATQGGQISIVDR